MPKHDLIEIAWCSDPIEAEALASFFAANIKPDYISHSELQGARALDVGRWQPGLPAILRNEIANRIGREQGLVSAAGASHPVLAAHAADRLVGVALVSLFPTAPVPYAIIEDVIVNLADRSLGVGKRIVDWVTREAERIGCARLFLESGISNHRAHEFFHREGFAECSVVMMKPIKPQA